MAACGGDAHHEVETALLRSYATELMRVCTTRDGVPRADWEQQLTLQLMPLVVSGHVEAEFAQRLRRLVRITLLPWSMPGAREPNADREAFAEAIALMRESGEHALPESLNDIDLASLTPTLVHETVSLHVSVTGDLRKRDEVARDYGFPSDALATP